MFEKFTKDARSAVVDAQLVARAAHSDQIDSRHLLVALAEREGPARFVLADGSLDVADVASRRGRARRCDSIPATT